MSFVDERERERERKWGREEGRKENKERKKEREEGKRKKEDHGIYYSLKMNKKGKIGDIISNYML